ncbi:hypothetical protein D9615_003434 [Tricholomella constricta]|uniref:Uncharacterized protein n=1 Tax=Tricholomella constricta TaxID=117010 RepID=A0A8H5HJA5_9AGAR|nr:hypothetical protein D9615_003434 [Tricholomella constricta]
MGGLLAAEAATHASNNTGTKPTRIVGMIAFDTPYLGMHPHVVVTGIASIFQRDEEGKKHTDTTMNDTTKVTVVDGNVTEDWDAFKDSLSASARPASLATSGSNSRLPSPVPSSPSPTYSSQILHSSQPFVDRGMAFLSSHSNDPLVRWARKHADDPFNASKRWVIERFQFGSCMFDPSGLKDRYSRLVAWQGGVWVNYWTQTAPKTGLEGRADPVMDDLIGQKEIEMADNDAVPLDKGIAAQSQNSPDFNSAPPIEPQKSPSPSIPSSPQSLPVHGAPTKSEAQAIAKAERQAAKDLEKARKREEKDREKALKMEQKRRDVEAKKAQKAEKERNKVKLGRHFIVLPTGFGQVLGGSENWEKVVIGGVEDEVAAHCGLFIRGQNLDYDGLVERVGNQVLGWCESL